MAGARVHVPEGVDARTLSVVLAALRRDVVIGLRGELEGLGGVAAD